MNKLDVRLATSEVSCQEEQDTDTCFEDAKEGMINADRALLASAARDERLVSGEGRKIQLLMTFLCTRESG